MKRMMTMALGASAAWWMLGACTRGEDVTVAAPELVAYGAVTDDISAAICNRELRCDEIGPDDDYDTVGECMSDKAEDVVNELPADECGEGIYRDQLEACVARLEAVECDQSDDIDDVEACRESVLCQDIRY